MRSQSIQVHGQTDRPGAPAKKLWTKPSIEVIALENAQQGHPTGNFDHSGVHVVRNRS